ncbi:hypothetical protein SELMODRAFT_412327 [Selaginella moellendorffii]|uniref:Uncharacterized protein n=1 Tax=Selaginella moellendorffii TaxID=88036 RepID=D8RKT1_SELML|nr:hypothetical protein SELMODRAFT_412327 [Selaginella moellendorffii]
MDWQYMENTWPGQYTNNQPIDLNTVLYSFLNEFLIGHVSNVAASQTSMFVLVELDEARFLPMCTVFLPIFRVSDDGKNLDLDGQVDSNGCNRSISINCNTLSKKNCTNLPNISIARSARSYACFEIASTGQRKQILSTMQAMKRALQTVNMLTNFTVDYAIEGETAIDALRAIEASLTCETKCQTHADTLIVGSFSLTTWRRPENCGHGHGELTIIRPETLKRKNLTLQMYQGVPD